MDCRWTSPFASSHLDGFMSRKILITGANGFVARYLVSALKAVGDGIIGVDDAMVFNMGSDTIVPPCRLLMQRGRKY